MKGFLEKNRIIAIALAIVIVLCIILDHYFTGSNKGNICCVGWEYHIKPC